ncbi:hypothetical protein B0H66DRAFT_171251 [Apodospora peruviana]|uniref:Uncharacterized protein n=1 Tax=Apodospora peruviana TaxID=516989 RepID=A0AAE0IKP1_9PEZI|nr:hypothetical protein B0H66DRAFT_171251 [Apodospora peruviana]
MRDWEMCLKRNPITRERDNRPVMQALLDCNKNEKKAFKQLQKNHRPKVTCRDVVAHAKSLSKGLAAEEEDDHHSDASDNESVTSFVRHYDMHGFPSGSVLAGTASTHIAEMLRKSDQSVKLPIHIRFDEEGNEMAGEPDLTQETNKHATRSPSTTSNKSRDNGGESESKNDSDSESESENDSGPEVESTRIPPPDTAGLEKAAAYPLPSSDDSSNTDTDDSSSNSSSRDSDSDSEDSEDSEESEDDNSFNMDLSSGESSPDSDGYSSSSDSDSSSEQEPARESNNDKKGSEPKVQGPTSKNTTAVAPGLAQKAKQLAMKNTPVPGATSETSGVVTDQAGNATLAMAKDAPANTQDVLAAKRAKLLESLDSLPGFELNEAESHQSPTPASTSSERRTKLDVVAGRRMLFSSLGLKNPKSKSDEDKIRQKLMENVRPLPNARDDGRDVGKAGVVHQSDKEDTKDWREKINYRAVECCKKNVELSEPPFPFVQRWDPQQQGVKRKLRDQPAFYDDATNAKSKKRKLKKLGRDGQHVDGNHGYGGAEEESYLSADNYGNADITLNYDDEPETEPGPETQQEQSISHVGQDDGDDLPPVPSDLTTLASLQPGEIKPGMVLTWKQWLLSKATNWQPLVANLTALVVNVEDDSLRVLLAKRDRNLDRNAKEYDEAGNQVYDKFELPGMDEDMDEDAELGYRTLNITDMIEPRVLRPESPRLLPLEKDDDIPECQETQASLTVPDSASNKSSAGDQSTTLDHEPENEDENPSQVEVDDRQSGESMIPETNLESVGEGHAADLDGDVSMTEDRRQEISQLINDAGFRKDLDPAIANDGSAQLSSPSRQLEETSEEAAPAPDQPTDQPVTLSSPVFAFPDDEVLPDTSQALAYSSLSPDSQPITLEPFNGFSDDMNENEPPPSESDARVEYPTLDLPPSDTGSVRSGRQPDPDFSIKLGNDCYGCPEGIAEGSGTSPSSRHANARGKEAKKSAVKSAIKARKSDAAPDPEYDEAMRRIDDGSDPSDSSASDFDDADPFDMAAKKRKQISLGSAQNLVDKPIEKPAVKRAPAQKLAGKSSSSRIVKSERQSSQAQMSKLSGTSKHNELFSIPEGSQVVSLLTSSPEPEEDYAEDGADGTYEDPDSLPCGSGWVKKNRVRRGVSLPAAASTTTRGNAPRRFAASQSRQSLGPVSGATLQQGRKKTLLKTF